MVISPELKNLVTSALEREIEQAIEAELRVSCKLELIGQNRPDVETPNQARLRQLEVQRQRVVESILADNVVQKLNHALGAELVESSVRKTDDSSKPVGRG